MDIPEKLFKDLYFQLLQSKKSDQVSTSAATLRELISLSQIHCSNQNMTTQGAEEYKSELFTEYFKVMDLKDTNNLLPVSVDFREKKLPCVQSNQSHLLKSRLNEFGSILQAFGSGNKLKSGELQSSSSQLSSKGLNSLFLTNKETGVKPAHSLLSMSKNLSCKAAEEKKHIKPIVSNNPTSTWSNHPKKCQQSDFKTDLNNYSNKFPKKKRLDEESETYRNKKVCAQAKTEPKATNIGFMSASKMYRNPLKKNSPNSEEETDKQDKEAEPKNEAFKNFDKKIVDIVLNEIMDFSPNIKWSDIAGLEFVKTTVQEIVIWPLLRPDIFTGLRAPPRGILLFGPPGTGKTLIGKCIATESNSTFFCISASSLASKWVGESEQMVRVLFAAARLNQPAVIFIDEIDSLLSQRNDKEQDFTRKLKTEFLVQFDGAKTNTEERVLVVGATNRPHELDEAARRRFVKRLFVPLPNESARIQIIQKLLNTHQHNLSSEDLQKICDETEGYSGSDVAHLCKEAAMGPIRSIGPDEIKTVSLDQVRPISLCDFTDALRQVRASVAVDDLNYYTEWNKKFGSFGIPV